jgi:hypothetical protein
VIIPNTKSTILKIVDVLKTIVVLFIQIILKLTKIKLDFIEKYSKVNLLKMNKLLKKL